MLSDEIASIRHWANKRRKLVQTPAAVEKLARTNFPENAARQDAL
jgi:hypothetical protein